MLCLCCGSLLLMSAEQRYWMIERYVKQMFETSTKYNLNWIFSSNRSDNKEKTLSTHSRKNAYLNAVTKVTVRNHMFLQETRGFQWGGSLGIVYLSIRIARLGNNKNLPTLGCRRVNNLQNQKYPLFMRIEFFNIRPYINATPSAEAVSGRIF